MVAPHAKHHPAPAAPAKSVHFRRSVSRASTIQMDSQVMACVGRSRDSCLAGRIGLGRRQSGWLRSVLESVVDQLRRFKCRAENHPPQSEVDLQSLQHACPPARWSCDDSRSSRPGKSSWLIVNKAFRGQILCQFGTNSVPDFHRHQFVIDATGPKSRLSHRLLIPIEIRPDRAAFLFRDPVVELPT